MQEPHSKASFVVCSLDRNWWVFALRGLAGLVFGMLILMMPVAALFALTITFGAYALVEGILNLVAGIRHANKGKRWKWMVASGVLGLVAGILALVWLPAAAMGLSYLLWGVMAAWLMAAGITEVASATSLRGMGRGALLMGIRGGLSIVVSMGILYILTKGPGTSLAMLGILIASGALLSGVTLLALAIRLRRLTRPG